MFAALVSSIWTIFTFRVQLPEMSQFLCMHSGLDLILCELLPDHKLGSLKTGTCMSHRMYLHCLGLMLSSNLFTYRQYF